MAPVFLWGKAGGVERFSLVVLFNLTTSLTSVLIAMHQVKTPNSAALHLGGRGRRIFL